MAKGAAASSPQVKTPSPKAKATKALKRVKLAPADEKVLKALAAATARDDEECDSVGKAFEQHVCGEYSPITAVQYRRSFQRLFKLHKKTFSAMASDEFVGVVRGMKEVNSRSHAASMKVFGAFWKKQAEAPALKTGKSEGASAEDPQHRTRILRKTRILRASAKAYKTFFPKSKPGRSIRLSDKIGQVEANKISEGLQSFINHMHVTKGRRTAADYAVALRTLIGWHGESLDAMASMEYVDRVRKMGLCTRHAAAAGAFYRFRSLDRSQQGSSNATEPRKRKLPSADATGDAGDLAESFTRDLQPFLDHLREKNQWTAIQYGQALRKLAREHPASLDGMASQKYLDKVRGLNWQRKFAAAVVALCKFRSIEVPAQREHADADATGDAGDPAESFTRDLQPFLDHLREKNQWTAIQYGQALRKLAREHPESLDGMASQKYLDKVRGLNWQRKFAAAVVALCKFRSVEVPGSVEVPVQGEHADAEAGSMQGLQPFLAHVRAKKSPFTAVQYERAIRKLVRVHQKSPDAMASQEYLDKVRELKWERKYAAAVRALCKFRSGVAWSHPELRERANTEARRRSEAARASSRPVSDSDILEVLRLLPFAQNTKRRNVMPKGTDWVHSTTVGIIGDWRGHIVISNATVGNEEVVKLLCKWMERQLGVDLGSEAFPVTSININKGYAAARHRDKNNQGPSAIRALGDCRGGLLRYWPTAAAGADLDALRDEDSLVLDPRHNIVFFDGNYPHAVTPFEGERYSVVFFTSASHKRAASECRTKARRLGMRWPTPQLLAAANARVAKP